MIEQGERIRVHPVYLFITTPWMQVLLKKLKNIFIVAREIIITGGKAESLRLNFIIDVMPVNS